MDKKQRTRLTDILATAFIAMFLAGCLLLTRCPSDTSVDVKGYSGIRDSNRARTSQDTISTATKIKKEKKEKPRKRPKERNFRDEPIPSSF